MNKQSVQVKNQDHSNIASPDDAEIITRGREVIAIEREALEQIMGGVDVEFSRCIKLLEECQGKIVLTGLGKSGIIAQKMTATLNSTGVPALYLHPIDALHGDLGVIQQHDVVVIFSKSGESDEIHKLYPALRSLRIPIVAITGNTQVYLAAKADISLDITVEREACPYDLAPTSSTTAMLAMADALSVVLYERKGFTRDDFASTHPGGTIGRRLLLHIADIMKKGEALPIVGPEEIFKTVILEMSQKRIGAALVVEDSILQGIITDGDLRRILERSPDIQAMTAREMMTSDPMTADPSMLGAYALQVLEDHKRTHLPVVNAEGVLLGIVHIHDLIEAGLQT